MKKLKLELDDLTVESFEPVVRHDSASAGTVRGRDSEWSMETDCAECITVPVESEDDPSCYQTHCVETGYYVCTDIGECTWYCASIGEC